MAIQTPRFNIGGQDTSGLLDRLRDRRQPGFLDNFNQILQMIQLRQAREGFGARPEDEDEDVLSIQDALAGVRRGGIINDVAGSNIRNEEVIEAIRAMPGPSIQFRPVGS